MLRSHCAFASTLKFNIISVVIQNTDMGPIVCIDLINDILKLTKMINKILPNHSMGLHFQLWQLLLGRLVLCEAYKNKEKSISFQYLYSRSYDFYVQIFKFVIGISCNSSLIGIAF